VTLPTFLVIGSLKAGTTSLWTYLRAHPEIYMPGEKELRFFVEQHNWHRGRAWYESQFAEAGDARALGEASPSYTISTSFPGVPERIASMIPEAKLIYVMRHPIDRMRSHYLQRVADGTETMPVEDAFRHNLDYIHTSRYAFQLEPYLERFPLERILLITSEDLRDQRPQTLRRVYSFLGVDPEFVPPVLTEEANRTDARRERVPSVGRARDRSVYRALSRVAPGPVRRLHYRLTTRPMRTVEVQLEPETERLIVEGLRADIAQLRTYMPPGFDGWGIG
jgi:hypothetical protein